MRTVDDGGSLPGDEVVPVHPESAHRLRGVAGKTGAARTTAPGVRDAGRRPAGETSRPLTRPWPWPKSGFAAWRSRWICCKGSLNGSVSATPGWSTS